MAEDEEDAQRKFLMANGWTEKQLFYLEVGRASFELDYYHRWDADLYAARLAANALAEGDAEGHRFWEAVAAALRPRGIAA
ncbi:hypothetical protein [Mesorhizobium hawassense]|uniref:hypothetical protein n=1 Tax=Mesorhizobium hawassense TaxID=1209954 RepID=UPI0011BF502B|nr:hypothetical protein [Mesorhizobium hawassense]